MADNSNNQKPAGKKKARDTFGEEDIFQAPVITRDPSSRQAKLGSRVVLRVTAEGRPLPSYQWFHNGKKISGANSDRLTLTKVRHQAIGAYHCEVKNFVGKAVTRAAMLSFFTQRIPKLEIGPENSKLEEGKPFTLSVTSPAPKELKDLKIYWMFNGMRIKGAHGPTLTISGAKKKYEGEYKAMIATGSGLETSNVAKLTVKPPKAAPAAPETIPVTEEQNPLAGQPTGGREMPAKPLPSWDAFNFNPEEDNEEALVAPAEGSELYENTSPGTPGAPRSPISQLGTQDLIRELAAQDALEDPSSLIAIAETPSDAPAEDENDLIVDWADSPAAKKNESNLHSMAASPAPTQLALARKKAFLEEMLRKFQDRDARGKRAA